MDPVGHGCGGGVVCGLVGRTHETDTLGFTSHKRLSCRYGPVQAQKPIFLEDRFLFFCAPRVLTRPPNMDTHGMYIPASNVLV